MIYKVLYTVRYYQYLAAPQVRRILFPHHKSGRATRGYLNKLRQKGWLQRTKAFFPYGDHRTGGTPVWYITAAGLQALAAYRDDDRLLYGRTRPPRESHAQHWLALVDSRIAFDQAAALHRGTFGIVKWLNEWEPVNPEDAKSRFCLHAVLQQNPPLSCSPDAGCLVHVPATDERMVIYLEQDRNTGTGPKQLARQKMPGYVELQRRMIHKQHFPAANIDTFVTLLITTSDSRLRQIARALHERGEGADQWLLTTTKLLTPENFPYGDIFFNHRLENGPLLKRPERQPT